MKLIETDLILMVAADSVSDDVVQKWTVSGLVASAAARRKGGLHLTSDLLSILGECGWVVQANAVNSRKPMDLSTSIGSDAPGCSELRGFLDLIAGEIPDAGSSLLSSWLNNASIQAGTMVICIGAILASRDLILADLRWLDLPVPQWRWLAAVEGRITNVQLALNNDVYSRVQTALTEKAKPLMGTVKVFSTGATTA